MAARVPPVQERLGETMQRICRYAEHHGPDSPILAAEEENRALYGAVIAPVARTPLDGSCCTGVCR